MIQDIIKHRLDYAILAVCASVYIVFFLSHQYNPASLLVATLVFGLTYFVWGIYHHLKLGTLHLKIMLEYLLVSIFSVLLVTTLLI